MKKYILKLINKLGYNLVKNQKQENVHPDIISKEFWDIYSFCKPYTMTSVERMYGLYTSVNYVLTNNIKGDFVECGVWRGGSSMLIAKMLINRNITDRKIYLYDTFEGMSEPTSSDLSFKGEGANDLLETFVENKRDSVWCLADLNEVKRNMNSTGYLSDNIFYVQGKVEETIPAQMPSGTISLLRLDTDWYESTKHELVHLYPMLIKNGVLIIDDYGHWQGCRKAVDEYIEENKLSLLLNRIDYTGRVAIKNN